MRAARIAQVIVVCSVLTQSEAGAQGPIARGGLIWRRIGPDVIAYGEPETGAVVKLRCVALGRYELTVGDPTERSRKTPGRTADIIAGRLSERAPFRVEAGHGDRLVLGLPQGSIPLATLARGSELRVRLPSDETVTVTGSGAAKPASALQASCGRGRTAETRPAKPRGTEGTDNDGWWVVLATGPGTPDRSTNGGAAVDQAAARCGIRTFNDFSAKFVGFQPGYNVFVLLGSPYGSRQVAQNNLRIVAPCFPGAYVKSARYLGE